MYVCSMCTYLQGKYVTKPSSTKKFFFGNMGSLTNKIVKFVAKSSSRQFSNGQSTLNYVLFEAVWELASWFFKKGETRCKKYSMQEDLL